MAQRATQAAAALAEQATLQIATHAKLVVAAATRCTAKAVFAVDLAMLLMILCEAVTAARRKASTQKAFLALRASRAAVAAQGA